MSTEMNTELLISGPRGSSRGLLFTPSFGLTKLFLGKGRCSGGVRFLVGPTWFINFEGASEFDGLAATISFSGGAMCD
ncbi:hypothetical protein JYU19_02580 [bacterium AH-315-J21]|nr:hypothetical protein [bacterium AH-315-J21]